MGRRATALARGWRFRCPACGKGRLRTRWLAFSHACPHCRHVYLRDPGDWTGAAETTFILTVAVGLAAFFLLKAWRLAPAWRITWTMTAAMAAFTVIYPRIRGLWIGVISLWDDRSPAPPAVLPMEHDPEWEHPSATGPR